MNAKLNFNQKETEIITALAEKKGMSVDNLAKQALRVYQMIEHKISTGEITQESLNKFLNVPKPVGLDSFED